MLPRLRLTARETIIDTSPQADARAAAAFARDEAIAFPDIFSDDICAMLDRARAGATQEERIDDVGPRLREMPPRSSAILCGLLNRAALRDWIAAITGCGPLEKAKGVTNTFVAGSGRLDWHTDLNPEPRRLGVTIGLGHAPYEGGTFEIKRRDSEDVLLRFDHRQPFAMLVFRVDPALHHRVLPVTAGGPRVVFGGWFLGPSRV